MTLYNLRTDGTNYRITKFDNDLNVESSYLVSRDECECPAGHRSTCRHRQMLPMMLNESLCDTGGFYDFPSGQVLKPVSEALPEGVTMLSLDDPEELHNAIADAVGEPHSTMASVPDFDSGDTGSNPVAATNPPAVEPRATAYESQGVPKSNQAQLTAGGPHPTIGPIKRRI